MAQHICSSITLTNGENIFYEVKKELDNFSFQCTNGKEAWKGIVTKNELQAMSEEANQSHEAFVRLFSDAFLLDTSIKEEKIFRYKLFKPIQTSHDYDLTWSQYLPADNIQLKLGHINLKEVNTDESQKIVQSIFNVLLDVNKTTKERCARVEAVCNTERSMADSALKKLEEFSAVQVKAEKVLFTNFVAILNEKKRRIRELTDECNILRKKLDSLEYSPDKETETGRREISKDTNVRKRSSKAIQPRKNKPKACPKKAKSVDYESSDTTCSTATHKETGLLGLDDSETDVDDTSPSITIQKANESVDDITGDEFGKIGESYSDTKISPVKRINDCHKAEDARLENQKSMESSKNDSLSLLDDLLL